MNALQALSLNVPVQDLMLNHLMLATLDPEMQRDWELINASRNNPTPAVLVTFLESRCRAIELLQTTQSLKVFPNISRSSQITGNKVSKSCSNVESQLECSWFNGSHRMFKCDKIIKMKAMQSLNHAKMSGLFFSTAFNILLRITHVRSKFVVSVTRNIIPCCTSAGKFK